MVGPTTAEAITALKTFLLLRGWSKCGELDEALTSGDSTIRFPAFYHSADPDEFNFRSVHNIRIERLWVDYVQGVANKWVDFFYELELYYGLQPDNAAHIWLLHYLFLDAVNVDLEEWVEAWNSHKISLAAGQRSPRDMFTFGLLEQGPRGLDTVLYQQEEAAFEHIEEFGVDWDAQTDVGVLQHFADNNAPQTAEGNPFSVFTAPATMNEVIVEPPMGPLSAEQIAELNQSLRALVDLCSRDMGVRKLVWQEAVGICTTFFET
jgi:hypothetical protein